MIINQKYNSKGNFIMTKIGRNSPCPCGSGLKYKNCCLNKKRNNSIPRYQVDFKGFIQKKEQERARQERRYGKIRPIISTNFDGKKWIAVGSQLIYSENWRTFPDFLISYMGTVLGIEWGNAEIKKPFDKRHQILKWYDAMCRFQQKQKRNCDGVYEALPNGPFAAYLYLAYDLYILRDHKALQNEIVERLKKSDQFQGARYELFATATCIRAGYDIEFEDETDRSKKHVEFIGTHRHSGQKISVEAKSKHREGILGYKGNKKPDKLIRLRVGSLLNKSLKKAHEYPFVVFIDVNLPLIIAKDVFKMPPPNAISRMMEKIELKKDGKDKFNLLIFTNHPQHYGREDNPVPGKNVMTIISQNPCIVPEKPGSLIALHDASMQYGNIPNDFPEE